VSLPMHRPIEAYTYADPEGIQPLALDPKEAGIDTDLRSVPLPVECKETSVEGLRRLAAVAAENGHAALRGEVGPAKNALIYSASALLYAIGHYPTLADAAKIVRQRMDSGAALDRFKRMNSAARP